MYQVPILGPDEVVVGRPFTDPGRIANDLNTIRFMIDQLCLFLESEHLYAHLSSPIVLHQPSRQNWLYRWVIARPGKLMDDGELDFVGFLGDRRADANLALADEFDEILVSEIPDYPGLLSYSTMALASGNFSNLVVFDDPAVKQLWSRSKAHDQAVHRLSPDYYHSIRLYNGKLPRGIMDSHGLRLTKVKYFDYQVEPRWHAVRVFPDGAI